MVGPGSFNQQSITLTPKENDNGNFVATIALSDGNERVEQALEILLQPVNDAPCFSNRFSEYFSGEWAI